MQMEAMIAKNRGVTLVELLVAVAVLGVLLMVAVPSFTAMIVNNRLKGYANAMVSTLQLARSEAIKRNKRVALCKSSNGTSCAGNWQDGWIIFVDTNNNGTADAGEDIIHRINALATGYTLSGNTNIANYVSYTPQGVTQLTTNAMQSGTFTLCPPAPAGGRFRLVVISTTGRPRIETTADTVPCP